MMLANYFGSVRFVYNHFLAERKETIREDQEKLKLLRAGKGIDCNEED